MSTRCLSVYAKCKEKKNTNAKSDIPVPDHAKTVLGKKQKNKLFRCYSHTFEKNDLNFVNINGSMSSCNTIFAIMNPTHLHRTNEENINKTIEKFNKKKVTEQ